MAYVTCPKCNGEAGKPCDYCAMTGQAQKCLVCGGVLDPYCEGCSVSPADMKQCTCMELPNER